MLSDCHILVVEDEIITALELVTILTREGAIVIGPAQSVPEALRFVANNSIDCAILDIELIGGSSFAIADALADHRVPFLFVTGYDDGRIPPRHREKPAIAKPFAHNSILQAVDGLVSRCIG